MSDVTLNGAAPPAAPVPAIAEVLTNVTLPDGRVFDLSKAFPLTLGDWETLEAAGVMNQETGRLVLNAKTTITMLALLINKLDATVTRVEVAKLPMSMLPKFAEVLTLMNKTEQEQMARPTPADSSTTSTSLAPPTDGAEKT